MNTSQSNADAVLLETRYVWGKTVASAMERAMAEEKNGWKIQGNPSPMTYNGCYGTGVSITRINDV